MNYLQDSAGSPPYRAGRRAGEFGQLSCSSPPTFSSLMRLLPPEIAHRTAIRLLQLRSKFTPIRYRKPQSQPLIRAAGIEVPNPIGLAAGFDKNAEVVDVAFDLGFGFVEVGSVTLHPRQGTYGPRLHRLTSDRALINNMGLNNHGVDSIVQRLKACRHNGVVGLSIAGTYEEDVVYNHCAVAEAVAGLVDYVTINASCPNSANSLPPWASYHIYRIVHRIRDLLPTNTAIWVKIPVDLTEKDVIYLTEALVTLPIQGIVVGNTTTTRPSTLNASDKERHYKGGLSGPPLKPLAIQTIQIMRPITAGRIDLIGCGGIESAEDVQEYLGAGASLVQLYTALTYKGLGLPKRIIRELESEGQANDSA